MNQKSEQRREFKRGGLQRVILYNMRKISEEGYMTNLSKGGCLIYCYSPVPVQVNKQIEISFGLKNSSDIISLKGQIVRATKYNRGTNDYNYQLGIKFLRLTEKQGKAIENLVRRFLKDINQE